MATSAPEAPAAEPKPAARTRNKTNGRAPKTTKAPAKRAKAKVPGLSDQQVAEALSKFPFYFEMVPIGLMFVDHDYQRPPTSLVTAIENHFNPSLVGTLSLSLRGSGKYAVIDGQTRMIGTEKLGFVALPSLVYEGLSKADEAGVFELLQTQRRNATSWTRFRAALVAKNPESLAIKALVESIGRKVGGDPDSIRSVAALEYGYRLHPFTLERSLVALTAAYPDRVPSGQLIRSMHYFLMRNSQIDDVKLERRLKATGLEELTIRAAHLRASKAKVDGRGAISYLAQAIKNTYQA